MNILTKRAKILISAYNDENNYGNRIAKITNITQRTVYKTLNELEQKGLIEMNRYSQVTDRIILTEKGYELAEKLNKIYWLTKGGVNE